MPRTLRRLATFFLLLAVPLRVYAAAAMLFCGPAHDAIDTGSTHAVHQAHDTADDGASGHRHDASAHASAHASASAQDGKAGAPSDRPDADVGGSVQEHGTCSACCSTAMISTPPLDWTPQSPLSPAMHASIATAVPTAVPQRLERPPRIILA